MQSELVQNPTRPRTSSLLSSPFFNLGVALFVIFVLFVYYHLRFKKRHGHRRREPHVEYHNVTVTKDPKTYVQSSDIVQSIEKVASSQLNQDQEREQLHYAADLLHAYGAQRCHGKRCSCYKESLNDLMQHVGEHACKNRSMRFKSAYLALLLVTPSYLKKGFPNFPCSSSFSWSFSEIPPPCRLTPSSS